MGTRRLPLFPLSLNSPTPTASLPRLKAPILRPEGLSLPDSPGQALPPYAAASADYSRPFNAFQLRQFLYEKGFRSVKDLTLTGTERCHSDDTIQYWAGRRNNNKSKPGKGDLSSPACRKASRTGCAPVLYRFKTLLIGQAVGLLQGPPGCQSFEPGSREREADKRIGPCFVELAELLDQMQSSTQAAQAGQK